MRYWPSCNSDRTNELFLLIRTYYRHRWLLARKSAAQRGSSVGNDKCRPYGDYSANCEHGATVVALYRRTNGISNRLNICLAFLQFGTIIEINQMPIYMQWLQKIFCHFIDHDTYEITYQLITYYLSNNYYYFIFLLLFIFYYFLSNYNYLSNNNLIRFQYIKFCIAIKMKRESW